MPDWGGGGGGGGGGNVRAQKHLVGQPFPARYYIRRLRQGQRGGNYPWGRGGGGGGGGGGPLTNIVNARTPSRAALFQRGTDLARGAFQNRLIIGGSVGGVRWN